MPVLRTYVDTENFQLPLSGSLENGQTFICLQNRVAFNSLSRDHERIRGLETASDEAAFNSLSRDHVTREKSYVGERLDTFNSLSRDHAHEEAEEPARAGQNFQLPLSGSRNFIIFEDSEDEILRFQLPLSGSPLSGSLNGSVLRVLTAGSPTFQLPLSGSLV